MTQEAKRSEQRLLSILLQQWKFLFAFALLCKMFLFHLILHDCECKRAEEVNEFFKKSMFVHDLELNLLRKKICRNYKHGRLLHCLL